MNGCKLINSFLKYGEKSKNKLNNITFGTNVNFQLHKIFNDIASLIKKIRNSCINN